MDTNIILRHATKADWNGIAELIYMSTNYWYQANGKPAIFQGEPSSTRLFCEVYDDLDPGRCILAVDEGMGSIVGSCFYHPRETHVSLGIMNSHPNYSGKGVARKLLKFITDFADNQGKPVRLVSSAMNLDSFSLYNRSGFTPYTVYQDMILGIPESGVPEKVPDGKTIRDAALEDVAAMVALEEQAIGVRRGSDFEYFIRNEKGPWHMSVIEESGGGLCGFLASIQDPGSALLGPGCMLDDEDAIALIRRELNVRKGHTMVWLVPSNRPAIVQDMYSIKARNCEIHLGQTNGPAPDVKGVVMPTFMPETA